MIEKGRHLNIHKTKRICKFCPNVEDEFHSVMECKTYSEVRLQLWEKIKQKHERFVTLDSNSKFKAMLLDARICSLVAEYLAQTLGIREFLLNKHKSTE